MELFTQAAGYLKIKAASVSLFEGTAIKAASHVVTRGSGGVHTSTSRHTPVCSCTAGLVLQGR